MDRLLILTVIAAAVTTAAHHERSLQEELTVGNDPAYAKYFKSLKIGLPLNMAQHMMKKDGVDPEILDNPDALVSSLKISTIKKKKTTGTPSLKMRKFFFQEVSQQEKMSTMWRTSGNVVEIDRNELQDRFLSGNINTRIQSRRDEKKLIDPKRAHLFGLKLSAFRQLKYFEIRNAILKLDQNFLSALRLKILIQLAPTEKEKQIVNDYIDQGKPLTSLGKAEQFIFTMNSIPNYQHRLQAIYASWSLKSEVQDTYRMIQVITDACQQISQSDRFETTLRSILAIGNEMGNRNEIGIKIQSLEKITAVKFVKGKGNLMDFLAQQLTRSSTSFISNLQDEISFTSEASRITFEQIELDIQKLKADERLVKTELDQHANRRSERSPQDKLELLLPYLRNFQNDLGRLGESQSEMITVYERVQQQFGASDLKAVEFFTIISRFIQELQQAYLKI